MTLRAHSALLAGVVIIGFSSAAAAEAPHSGHRQAGVDLSKKRHADPKVMRRIFAKSGSRPYFVHLRRDGKVSYRRLWRNTKRRLGNPKATPDTPDFLRHLEAWRARRGGGR